MNSAESAIAAVAALADDLRHSMYAYIRRAGHPVTRDEAATAVGISRKLAAFHLDKLVDAGLLETSYGRPGGLRRVGRAPKVYQPAELDVQVSIPPRDPELLAEILLEAILAENGPGAREAALRAAAERGRQLGMAERDRARPGRLGPERALTLTGAFLERSGYEPARAAPDLLLLRNCPFQPLAGRAPEFVCGINHALLDGFLEGLRAPSAVAANLRPRPGACCVELCAAVRAA
ncbi:MAG TPA: transcriptional regulator [Streptosporangiaceae bacterium]